MFALDETKRYTNCTFDPNYAMHKFQLLKAETQISDFLTTYVLKIESSSSCNELQCDIKNWKYCQIIDFYFMACSFEIVSFCISWTSWKFLREIRKTEDVVGNYERITKKKNNSWMKNNWRHCNVLLRFIYYDKTLPIFLCKMKLNKSQREIVTEKARTHTIVHWLECVKKKWNI